MNKNIWLACTVVIISLSVMTLVLPPNVTAQADDKSILLGSTNSGDLHKAKKIKKQGKISLKVWESYVKYSNTLAPAFRGAMLDGVDKLDVEYDEIWIKENDDAFTLSERKKYRGQMDIFTFYWRQGVVQALTVEKWYKGDPLTEQKFSRPTHKITNIYNRSMILKQIAKK